jgi:hypothetical protein
VLPKVGDDFMQFQKVETNKIKRKKKLSGLLISANGRDSSVRRKKEEFEEKFRSVKTIKMF